MLEGLSMNRPQTTFQVREDANGQPWIIARPLGGDLDMRRLVLDLHPDTSYAEAKEIAHYLQKRIVNASLI
jgi:hypothetical protein